MSESNHPEGLPKEVAEFTDALQRVPGVTEVHIGLDRIDAVKLEHLSLPGKIAKLPLLAIMRSGGGRNHEAVITAEIRLEHNHKGWIGLEFLSWWVRDSTRAGNQIQIRPIGFPPQVGESVQLGTTLTFFLEIFVREPSGDPLEIALRLENFITSLNLSLQLYEEAIRKATGE